ncbi:MULTISPECIES: cytochrome c3 family protein [unclassified Campylobacter]|uniref:cytochrome c3 family protein n=1 Tax=unclassified Campylobacter TaxID=2593542 RepID=UPI00147597BE|nr:MULTISPECIES: cytochrome c3 family protein [unclassified Campylobacter]QKF91546.1 cytochrome c3 [Campylobacter sp. CCUG 57310]
MLKIFKTLLIFCFTFSVALFAADLNSTTANKYTKENYPIKAHHEKFGLSCANCHKESDPKDYKALSANDCLSCHKSYASLAELSGHLGYDDNVHASPHYPNVDCNVCHASHKPSKNFCVMCHSQDTMKNLLVP